MSQAYKLLFQHNRQFVFEEVSETHSMAIVTLIAGFIGGSLLGVYFASLNLITAGSILFAIGTYITIITSTFSLKTNPVGVFMMFLTSFGTVITLIYVSRVTLAYLEESRLQIILVYAGVFAIIAELIYLWSRLTWVEDVRMHQLICVSNETIRTGISYTSSVANPPFIRSPSQSTASTPLSYPSSPHQVRPVASLSKFFQWALEQAKFTLYHIYYTLVGNHTKAAEFPVLFIERWSHWSLAKQHKPITIFNDTLKRIKVCIYHWTDYCCWVPVGGLEAGMLSLDRGEELIVSPHWPTDFFRVKIFAHGMIDFELASHASVKRGETYKFIDVAKPISIVVPLGSSPSSLVGLPSGGVVGRENSTTDDHAIQIITAGDSSFSPNSQGSSSNSSDELHPQYEMVTRTPSSHNATATPQSSSVGLKRNFSSRCNLNLLATEEDSPHWLDGYADNGHDIGVGGGSSKGPPLNDSLLGESSSNRNSNQSFNKTPKRLAQTRKRLFREFMSQIEHSNSVSVLNESTSDIKIIFYNIEDIAFVMSLDCFRTAYVSECGVGCKVADDDLASMSTNKRLGSSAPPSRAVSKQSASVSFIIPKNEWKVFELSGNPDQVRKYCMRVKMIGGSASPSNPIELAYCTVILGDMLVVRDPLVNI